MRWIAPRALTVAAPLVVLSVIVTGLAAAYQTFPGDARARDLAPKLGNAFEPIAYVFNDLHYFVFVPLVLLAMVLLIRRGEVGAAGIAIAVALARGPAQGLKPLVDRPRPEGAIDVPIDFSFPSGHVMTAALCAGVWFLFADRLTGARHVVAVRAASVTVVVLSALSRMWAEVHWLSDTYGAILIVATLFAVAFVFQPALGHATRAAVARRPRW